VARIELAKAMIVRSFFDEADAVLKPLADSNDAGVVLLRSRVLAETGKASEAVELIGRVIREGGADPRLVISKANLEIRLGRVPDAEQTLLDALNARPDAEPFYEALLDLYDPPQGGASAITAQTGKWRVLVKRLLGTIPNSRTGRLVQAQLHDAGRNYDRAEQILLELLGENPNDGRALNQLLDTYHAAGRTGEAITLLEARLEADPHNLVLLRMALRFYRASGEQDRLMQTQERVLMLEPESAGRSMRLGFIYRQWGKPQQAVEVLEEALQGEEIPNPVPLVSLLAAALEDLGEPGLAEKRIVAAIERFPDQEAGLGYLLATTVIRQGEQDRGEGLMRDNAGKFKDHGPSNNGLGYAMLMRNENPKLALELIQRAVDSEPGNEAYMDSLGWAYYKLKRYEDAEVWLRKARESAVGRVRQGGSIGATLAIINDHLGDTLHRLGRGPEALRFWAEAGRYIGSATADDLAADPELASLSGRLSDKIKAARTKKEVPVAEVPGLQEAGVQDAEALAPPKAQAPAPDPEPQPADVAP
jgi:tetratricopeptide (TPR) repeat protein